MIISCFFVSDSLIRSFVLSNLSESLTFAHMPWHERSERFAHSCSLVMSDLSKLLTFAHMPRAIWAICSRSLICSERFERMSDERMNKFPALLRRVLMEHPIKTKLRDSNVIKGWINEGRSHWWTTQNWAGHWSKQKMIYFEVYSDVTQIQDSK